MVSEKRVSIILDIIEDAKTVTIEDIIFYPAEETNSKDPCVGSIDGHGAS